MFNGMIDYLALIAMQSNGACFLCSTEILVLETFLDLAILHNIQNYANNKNIIKSNHAMLVDCCIRAKFYLPASLKKDPSLTSQLSSREMKVVNRAIHF
jgi:hypothetical protein